MAGTGRTRYFDDGASDPQSDLLEFRKGFRHEKHSLFYRRKRALKD
jgi:hypothetical protein